MHATVEPSDVRGATLDSLARPLGEFGYRLTSQTTGGVTFHRQYRTWPIRLLVVVTFPLGLVFLIFKREESISMSFEPEGRGTRIVVAGEGSAKVRRAFAEMATPR